MQVINRYLDESAARWNISPRAARWLFWMPLLISALLPLLRLIPGVYRALLREDGPVEDATALLFFVAFLAAGRAAIDLRRRGLRSQSILYVVFAFVMFFCAGEEVSWGQRFLGFDTPDAIEAINKQDELTLHNIGGSLDVFKAVMLLGGVAGAGAYLANEKLRIQRYWAHTDYLLVPPFFIASAFFLMAAFRIFRYLLVPDFNTTVTRYGEWIEFSFAYGFAVFALLVYRYVTAAEQVTAEVAVVL